MRGRRCARWRRRDCRSFPATEGRLRFGSAPIRSDILIPGALRTRIEGNEALASVRDLTPELLDQLEKENAASVRVEELSLEAW